MEDGKIPNTYAKAVAADMKAAFMKATTQYTPTPWRVGRNTNCSILSVPNYSSLIAEAKLPGDARRIVACVNALTAFTTEQIEQGIDLVALMEERDKHINALAVKTATILELRKEIERLKSEK